MSSNSTGKNAAEILAELQAVVAQAEKTIADATGEGAGWFGALQDQYEALLDRMGDLYANTRHKVVTGARTTDTAIREHPYQSMGLALALGVAAGLLITRGNRNDDHD